MASPNKKKLTAVCPPELVERIHHFRNGRGMSASEALVYLAEKGLEAAAAKDGGFLSAEAMALAEVFDKLDDREQKLLKQVADLMLEWVEALERAEAKPATNLIKVAARNHPSGPVQEEDIIPFTAGQVRQSDEEL